MARHSARRDYEDEWPAYVPVAERRRQAERAMAQRRKAGHPVTPVQIAGRTIATTFWGQAWCDNMESYRDYESRLPRGRTYVRNGSVVHLQIAPGRITAVVSGSELYDVTVTIKETPQTHWRSICADCAGGVDSLVELLQGRLSKGVMQRLCRQQGGLFPRPSDIRFTCSCPDHASMCKHVAAVLYGVGARLDQQPELLFRLRAVDEADLVVHIDAALPMSKQGPAAGRMLETDDVSALFGLDMAVPEPLATGKPSDKSKTGRARTVPVPERVASAANAAVPGTAGPKRASADILPTKPAPINTAIVAKKGAVKAVVPKQVSAAPKATPAKRLAAKQAVTARASARPVAPAKAVVAEVEGERQKALDTRERSGAHRQTKKSASAATPDVLQAPARGRGRSPGSRNKAATVRKPTQKPVKWW
jgi:uncharacterized Zn finger protein